MSGKKSLDKLRREHDSLHGLKTWIEISRKCFLANYRFFRKYIGPRVALWAVVKSNAYGHGLFVFSRLAEESGVDGFCADSFIEARNLRREGIRKPILVLGPTTLPFRKKATAHNISISISHIEALQSLKKFSTPPKFHLKIDTGMHRQGFLLSGLPKAAAVIKKSPKLKKHFKGIYTHFASAKDINYPTYTEVQFRAFEEASRFLRKQTGVKHIIEHCSATGAALVDKRYHKDAVRIGIGLYGLWPSLELGIQLRSATLHPVLSWKTVVSEIKRIGAREFVGYDLSERTTKPTKIAILPIGYWHGFPRALSHIGEVLIRGRRARVIGRVSMDLVAVDASGIQCSAGDVATLIGKDGREEINAFDTAQRAGTIHYEFLTRLNPLMERVLI